jgi:hypothetical protein
MVRADRPSNRRFLAARRRWCRVIVLQSDDKRGVVQVITSRSASRYPVAARERLARLTLDVCQRPASFTDR